MEFKILERPDEKEWEKNLMEDKYSDFLQSYSWAKILGCAYGFNNVFLEVRDANVPVAYLVLHEKYPFSKGLRMKEVLQNSINKVFFRNLTLASGPAIIDENITNRILIELLEWLETHCKKNNIIGIELTPFKNRMDTVDKTAMIDTFQSFGYKSKKWATYLVDLKQDEESLWTYIGKSARKALKKVKETDVVVKKAMDNNEYIEKFIKPYNNMEREAGRSGVPMWLVNKTKDMDVLNKHYHYYFAELGDEVIGVLGMCVYNGYATELMSTTSKIAYENKIYVQDLLHWNMFLDAENLGCHTFDLAGVNPNPQTSKEKGIHQFKKKWGGKYIEYYIFKKTLNARHIRFVKGAKSCFRKITGG